MSEQKWIVSAPGAETLLMRERENLFGLLARGDWASQFVSMHSDNMLFI